MSWLLHKLPHGLWMHQYAWPTLLMSWKHYVCMFVTPLGGICRTNSEYTQVATRRLGMMISLANFLEVLKFDVSILGEARLYCQYIPHVRHQRQPCKTQIWYLKYCTATSTAGDIWACLYRHLQDIKPAILIRMLCLLWTPLSAQLQLLLWERVCLSIRHQSLLSHGSIWHSTLMLHLLVRDA